MPDSITLDQIVANQGNTAVNSQTGAVTTYSGGALSSTGFNYNDGGFSTTITPESLQSATITPFAQPTATPPPDINALFATPPLTATPTETQAQSLSDRLMGLNDQLVGKSAYQTQQNTAFGVDAAQKTLTDLSTQLTQLKNEAAAIPLQIQQRGTEAGTPQPFLAGQENSRLRTNAIAALGVSSLMAAASGQLANAQSLADKAVAAKYDPIQERITALTNNLNIIMNSPNYTLEQKNRAQAQLDIQNKNQYLLDQQRQQTQDIYKIALAAAENGADAQTLQAIQNAKSPIEAATAYSGFVKQQSQLQAIQASGVTTPYAINGTEVLNSKTGYAYTSEADFQAKTGMTIQQAQSSGLISPVSISSSPLTNLDQYPASYQEYLLAKNEGYTGSYMDYQTADANRKAVRSTTNIYAGDVQTAKEETRVKQIISAHPNEWGQAADQIDKEFGAGTASKYDALLRDAYTADSELDPAVAAFLGL